MNLDQLIRVHTNLLTHSWSKLWYLCRALDTLGRGAVTVEWNYLLTTLKCASSTLYEWLRAGKKAGAFRAYKRSQGMIEIWLGGREVICQVLGLIDWGTTAFIPLKELLSEFQNAIATKITASRLQKASFNAKRRELPASRRREVKNPLELMEIVETQSNLSNMGRRVKGIEYISKTHLFVQEGFHLCGSSQLSIADFRNCSDRTVRRHLEKVNKRQLAIWKQDLNPVLSSLTFEASEGRKEREEIEIKNRTVNVNLGRLFKINGKVFLNCCNIYDLDFEFKSERFARRKFR